MGISLIGVRFAFCAGRQASFLSSTTAGHAQVEGEPPETLVRDLLQCFQGEFDNYDQVRQGG